MLTAPRRRASTPRFRVNLTRNRGAMTGSSKPACAASPRSERAFRWRRQCAGAGGLRRLHAAAQLHLPPQRRAVAGSERQCARPAGQVEGRDKPMPANCLARPASGGRADDLGARRADVIKDRLIAEGGWIDAPGCNVFNLYRPPILDADQRGDAGRCGSITSPSVYRRRRRRISSTGWRTACSARREDQPRAGARRQAGHRQGHAAGAGQARGRPVEFHRGVAAAAARPLQRLSEIGDPARQRGARPRRVQPLRLLRPHEGLSPPRRPTCCAIDEKNLARILDPQRLRRHHHHQPQDRRHLSAGRRPPPFRRLVRRSTRSDFDADYWNGLCALVRPRRLRDRRPLPRRLDLSGFDPKAPPPQTEASGKSSTPDAPPKAPNC